VTRSIWLFLNLPPPVHGAAVFNAAFAHELETRAIPHRIFRIGTKGSLTGVERFGMRKAVDDAVTFSELVGALRKLERRDSVVVYFSPSLTGSAVLRDVAVAEACKQLGVATVAHIHNGGWVHTWKTNGKVHAALMRRAVQHCERIICLGQSLAERMRAVTGLPCVGINNGIADGAARPRPTPPAGRIELLFLSNLQPEKGLWTAARATRSLNANGSRVRLRCAGGWRSPRDAEAFAADFAPELANGSIVLVGFVDGDAKAELLADAHFFLLPSELHEGQPLSIIEAMAAGVVPITTAMGGIPDLLAVEQWERLANSSHRTPEGIAETVASLASDTAAYAGFVDRCRRRYEAELTFAHCADQVLNVLGGQT
jgi:glycosyltransferase involved in cell wall biosynthesis